MSSVWLDDLLAKYRTVQANSASVTRRRNLNFVGAGFTLTDDEDNDATIVETSGGGGSTPTGTGFVHVTAGVQDGAAAAVNLAGGATYVTGYLPTANGGLGADASGYTGVLHFDAGAVNCTTIVNVDVSSSAAIAGTKIAPAFGSQNITFTGYIAQGATPATEGTERLGNTDSIAFRNNANTANIYGLSKDASDYVYVGVDSAATTTKTCARLISDCTTRTSFRCAGSEYIGVVNAGGNVQVLVGRSDLANFEVSSGGSYAQIKQGATPILLTDATNVYLAKPAIGHAGSSSPYAVHGGVSVTPGSDAAVTLSSSQYNQACILLQTGSWSSGHAVHFPAPASIAVGYSKMFINQSAYAATVDTGTGTTVSVGAGKAAVLWFDSTGVTRISADA